MSILRDVLAELFSMFVGDARLTAAILAVVGFTAVLISLASLSGIAAGAILLCGSLAVLILSVRREAIRRGGYR